VSITDGTRPIEPVRPAEPPRPVEPSRPTEPSRPSEPSRSGESFERTPPQDVAAEQCVLGGMLLSKDAIADVVEILRTADFYRPAHAAIFDAILDLYGRGEPADPITLAATLTDSGAIGRIGGAPYLHTLIASVPTAANSAYYAKIVRERAVLRRLIEAGTRIVQLGYGSATGGGRDTDDLVDLAQQAVYDVTDHRISEDFIKLSELLQPTLDEIETVGASGAAMTGVPTGFTDLDRLLNGLHPGQLIIVAGRPGLGKALALHTPLPTPGGWTTMGQVAVGDRLLGANGRPTTVTAVSGVMRGRPCFEVEFSDGSVIVADAEHRWVTTTRGGGPAEVRTTREIVATLRAGDRPNHSVAIARPLDLPARPLPIPPYALGVSLAAALFRPAAIDPEIIARVEADGGDVIAAGDRIPGAYLRAAEPDRRAVLAGLLDVAGTVARGGTIRVRHGSAALADDAYELIVSLGYRCGSTAGTLTFDAADDVFRLERKRIAHKQRRPATVAGHRYIVDVRPIDSVPVRCVSVDNDDHLYLAGRAMIPTHNSTAAMDFARSASVRHNLSSAIFSLEMSKVEIVTRLLSAEARVPLHTLRSGQLSDDDWTKLARRMGEISEAPLFVDDTPNMTLMEIRAKARRLRQRHDLKLVIVDYLQLMTSPKRVESRQQEVAELSRGLKLLAKEIECPVIAVSQLNRGPEQRTDKRPQLADLRESGCLTGATRVMRADTNAEVTLGELMSSGARDVPVWALDGRLKYVPRTLTHVFPSGHRPVFRLQLASGRQIDATANHPFLVFGGWRALGDLNVGDRVGVPRHVPAPSQVSPWADAEAILLAHLIGDGSFVRRQPIRYASVDEANLAAVTGAAEHFGVTAIRDDYPQARVSRLRLPAPYRLARSRRNPIAAWLDDLGLFGLRSHEKFIPESLFGVPKQQVALFLRHLWATDGSVTINRVSTGGRIYYASTSRPLLDGVSRLLLRFGINSRLLTVRSSRVGRPQFTLDVSGRDEQLRFLREIGAHGERAAMCEKLLGILEASTSNPNVDTVPREVWDHVRDILTDKQVTHRQFAAAMDTQFCGSTMWKHSPSRQRLARVAEVLDSAELDLYATNDIFWDRITAVEPLGEMDVFDATVLGEHNFIANGVAVHNSIEQDADVVILLHRDDYYDRESPRAGEADFIVAKHRNGPTDTVTVAAQLHLSRFVDMAII
jgi:replicative DNA helicase